MLTLALAAALGSGARHLERKPGAGAAGHHAGCHRRDLYGRRLDPVIDCGHIALQRVMDAGVDHCESLELHPEVGVPHALENARSGAVAASCDLRTLRFGGGRTCAGLATPACGCWPCTSAQLPVGPRRRPLGPERRRDGAALRGRSPSATSRTSTSPPTRSAAPVPRRSRKRSRRTSRCVVRELCDNWRKIMGAKAIGRAVSRNPPLRRLSLRLPDLRQRERNYLGSTSEAPTSAASTSRRTASSAATNTAVDGWPAPRSTSADNERNATHELVVVAAAAPPRSSPTPRAATPTISPPRVGAEPAAAFAAPLAANRVGARAARRWSARAPAPALGGALEADRRQRTLGWRRAQGHRTKSAPCAALHSGQAQNDHLTLRSSASAAVRRSAAQRSRRREQDRASIRRAVTDDRVLQSTNHGRHRQVEPPSAARTRPARWTTSHFARTGPAGDGRGRRRARAAVDTIATTPHGGLRRVGAARAALSPSAASMPTHVTAALSAAGSAASERGERRPATGMRPSAHDVAATRAAFKGARRNRRRRGASTAKLSTMRSAAQRARASTPAACSTMPPTRSTRRGRRRCIRRTASGRCCRALAAGEHVERHLGARLATMFFVYSQT